jgi:hypothetical protein
VVMLFVNWYANWTRHSETPHWSGSDVHIAFRHVAGWPLVVDP